MVIVVGAHIKFRARSGFTVPRFWFSMGFSTYCGRMYRISRDRFWGSDDHTFNYLACSFGDIYQTCCNNSRNIRRMDPIWSVPSVLSINIPECPVRGLLFYSLLFLRVNHLLRPLHSPIKSIIYENICENEWLKLIVYPTDWNVRFWNSAPVETLPSHSLITSFPLNQVEQNFRNVDLSESCVSLRMAVFPYVRTIIATRSSISKG
jgi:hypothetical protein